MPRRLEPSLYIGKKYNRYTILKEICRHKRVSITEVECKCDCGMIKIVPLTKILSGHSKSCGCYHKDIVKKETHKYTTKHGHASKRSATNKIYNMYHNMLKRCYDCNNKQYKNYGGRGIKVCKEWRNSLESFVTWCLEKGWKEGLNIDRKNNDKSYSPNNCRLVTPTVNHNNRRSTKIVKVDGLKLSVSEHARRNGLKPHTVFGRLKIGWSIDKAVKTKVGAQK